ncbi:MAG: Trk system potassium uptake protein [marine bacterium B5-7]|nr:MAG: Trk system potassium uptake protein [marine bacterium B5-7]
MRFFAIFRILGVLLMLFSLSMWPPIFVNWYYQDDSAWPFLISFCLTLLVGFCMWGLGKQRQQELRPRDGFLVVTLFWTVLCVFASLPLMIAKHPHIGFTNAMYETVSGFTTTGSTILTDFSTLSHAILYYRQQLQFLGGMGIIVLAIAVLPMLGVGGMQLYRAETPGPIKDSKLTPRITSTAKTLWFIYLGLIIVCAISYWLAGMTPFDAICESYSTVATGGFSIHSNSFAFYNSDLIDCIGILFMVLGGANFALFYAALNEMNFKVFWKDEEFRAYIKILLGFSLISCVVLLFHNVFHDSRHAFIESLFNISSLMTTTGFIDAPFDSWPSFLPILVMLGAMIGGCAASTSGGIKVIRILLLYKQTRREVERLIHPRAVIPVKFGGQVLPDHVVQSMWGFIAAFLVIFFVLILALMATGLDLRTAFGAVAANISNAGAGIGAVAHHFHDVSDVAKWLLIVAMLAGRLEIFTILVLFSPSFWRK